MRDRVQELRKKFERCFGDTPRVYQAPGRVNLIGEHTDYNDGFVMPAAIGFHTWIAIAPRTDRKLTARSEHFDEQVEFDLDKLPAQPTGSWSDYVAGVARMLSESGKRLQGASLLVDGDVPHGAGLSSSASFETAVGYALLDIAGERLPNSKALPLLCQKAENEFVGARCGIMDQFVCCHGKQSHALLLDCRSLEYCLLPLPEVRLVICNTMVKHSNSTGSYNERRSECEVGARYFAEHVPGVKALRDVTPEMFSAHEESLPETIRRRCRHVVAENARVLQAGEALKRGSLDEFGNLMAQSHRSLRDDFEVSCAELDVMVELATKVDGVYGARMTGGGFGGCTINLVRQSAVQSFQTVVKEGYQQAIGTIPEIYVCSAVDGVGRAL